MLGGASSILLKNPKKKLVDEQRELKYSKQNPLDTNMFYNHAQEQQEAVNHYTAVVDSSKSIPFLPHNSAPVMPRISVPVVSSPNTVPIIPPQVFPPFFSVVLLLLPYRISS